MFACGFSAMLIAIAVNTIDNKYVLVANQIEQCGMLRFCDRSATLHRDLSKDIELIINNVLHKFSACQEVRIKESICVRL